MNTKILIVANPNSGKKKKNNYYNEIVNNLKKQNYDVDIKYTTKQYNATNIIKNYNSDYNILIVCGGDGTLNEVKQALYEMNKKISIGFIPFGTTNDYARSMNISFDKLDLSKNINNYKVVEIDLGLFNNRVFNYSANFGLFSKTSYGVSYKLKNKIGRLAYILSGIKEIFNYKTYKMKFYYNDKEISDDFIYGSITNSRSIGGFKIYRKTDIKLNDGKFEVLLIKKTKNVFHTLFIFFKVLFGNLKDKHIYFFKTDNLLIESFSDCDWSIDGEYGGNSSKINIINLNKESKYIIPKINIEKY